MCTASPSDVDDAVHSVFLFQFQESVQTGQKVLQSVSPEAWMDQRRGKDDDDDDDGGGHVVMMMVVMLFLRMSS